MATEVIPQGKQGWFALVKEALTGTKRDLTGGSLNSAVLLLSIPMMLELGLESVFSLVDILWVSVLGNDAVASVGLTESLMTLAFAVSAGLSTAITALVARRIGEGDTERASIDAVQAIVVGLLLSVVIGVPLFLLAPKLLGLLGATASVRHVGFAYARITLGFSGVVILLSLNNAIFRGAGDAAIAMKLLWVANGINLVLDPLLIFGIGPFPKLGVAGPAVATLAGRGLALLYQGYLLAKGSGHLRIGWQHLKVKPSEMVRFVRVASAGMLQFLLQQGSWLGLVRIVSLFGAPAIAGYTIAVRILNFIMLPSLGLSNAAATLVGQNLGAGIVARARSSVWRTGFLNLALLSFACLLFFFFAKPIVSVFGHEKQAEPIAVECLRIFSVSNLFFAFSAVFMQAFNGAGDTTTPAYINLFGFWLVELPLAWVLARHTHLAIRGVFLAVLLAQVLALLLSGFLFLRGGWAKKRI
ncbi:MATE family efflux transporter [Acidipila sp. EB88]|uniref:MATE family efflux transporter n=1 Tax=Acidipila sp. EB88 TaxID=2305226 RepID=UPI000F5E2971|nr:MATE family efflux transporter [Acidipila sp. EB88]RRA50254.1 MATE family efflux transporter [Acidipila sp. EB88]